MGKQHACARKNSLCARSWGCLRLAFAKLGPMSSLFAEFQAMSSVGLQSRPWQVLAPVRGTAQDPFGGAEVDANALGERALQFTVPLHAWLP